ncbi:hypothetical protein [uncultured Deinococcus sp.]|uniref:hypothetical protein n=1 Tax=uncultured Deinococcus sp. TaxID=158789 RepID=UPI003747AD42
MRPPPRARPEVPQALHFVRLAQGSPGQWVVLPGGALQVLGLAGKADGGAQRGWLLCLHGEVLLDFPDGNFVRLRPGEGYAATGPWEALPTRTGSVLLLVAAGS